MARPLTRSALALAFAFALVCPVQADELDDKYLQVLNAVDQAAELEKSGKTDAAKARYQAMQKALLEIKKADPTWKANMVAHRLADVGAKLDAMSPKAATDTTAPPAPVEPAARPKSTPSTASRAPAVSQQVAVTPAEKSSAEVLRLIDAGREPR